LAGPPTAGLQGCQAIRSRLSVNRAVESPSREAVKAASQPACPPPTTITSKDSVGGGSDFMVLIYCLEGRWLLV